MSALSMEEVSIAKNKIRRDEIVTEINNALISNSMSYVEITIQNCNNLVARIVQEQFEIKGWDIDRQALSGHSYRFMIRC